MTFFYSDIEARLYLGLTVGLWQGWWWASGSRGNTEGKKWTSSKHGKMGQDVR